jgi:hypothetical protein
MLYRLEPAPWILSRSASVGYEWLALSVPLAERLIATFLARPKALREAAG